MNKLMKKYIIGFFIIIILWMIIWICGKHKKLFIMVENPLELYTITNQYIYFGRETCPSCKLAEKIIGPILEERGMLIYYFDTDKLREHEAFDVVLHDFEIEEVPMIVEIIDSNHYESLKIMDDQKRIDPYKIEQFLR